MSRQGDPLQHWNNELAALGNDLAKALQQAAKLQPVSVGATPREAVYQEDALSLYYYPATDRNIRCKPLLIVYSFVNRPYILDLSEQRSMIRHLCDAGIPVYLLDWGNPEPIDRFLTLEDYIDGYLRRCVDWIRRRHAVDTINMLGVCQGGTFSLCFTALWPEKVNSLTTLVTPVDFHAGNSVLTRLAKHADPDSVVDCFGNVPADLLNSVYVSLKPFRLLSQRYVELAALADNHTALAEFLRMEQWMYDSPDHPGEAYRQFARDFYQANKLVNGNLKLGRQAIDLRALNMPVFNVYAAADHLIPPASARALANFVDTADYSELEFPGGHLSVFISGRAQRSLFPALSEWLHKHG
ncbi:class III poly(R)-hydroxyalkanoic acid synthase subunit PhaC [Alkalilimnicola ehrlichii]|uniref:Poly(3-hydroxyalkanoate) polymerase subunit PhaC n=1 Tax=Alkalilimnicola ehrlichii TaxID=351052 RepID=A0A3E0X1K7_9GAMM|nr:class III poly(R)-hydroxyalkanoic acid synthase subunit PhaC [Alkalilimnicola ehrlichii]RFA31360.1 class III poly(R)-hydroxyalkanoic acid synthase subunit PhaC [Alkalilimnicola ehrlichii]RFA39367.1 class III poly(R)-hydroxyalkanoic acid synthase subunit PhaC [Alkalilimnicola ehrlichii]